MKYLDEQKLKRDPRVRSYKTKDGDKRYRVRFKKTILGNQLLFEKQGLKNSRLATQWADEAIHQAMLNNGTAKHVSVQEYFNLWRKRHTDVNDWKPDTIRDYDMIFNNHILPRYGNTKLEDINRNEFQEYLNSLYEIERVGKSSTKIGYSSKTISTIKHNFSIMLNEAVEDELIPINRIKRCRVKDTDKHKRNLSITEDKYFEAIDAANRVLDPIGLGMFYLSLLALRHGEIMGMQPQYVFLDHVQVEISRTLAAPDGNTLKNKRSYRDVPITPKVHKILQNAINASRQIYSECDKQLKKDSFIFVNRDARPMNYTTINHHFDLVSDEIGFHIYPHLMRHAFATFAMPQAADPVDVQNIMGHSHLDMTLKYDTGTEKRAKEIVKNMSVFG
ncbi:tyrosine-type recombinase/integrase [Paucilactobacillus kaifaensis]|uniref:tyrosine-type recombinase/integrase n=1 Tax=Paucilactobacillus kaifaensis TaxID=2559921 RepID=UPI0010F7D369|nr:site-specific integrase [Paucilactobacillus kaifaensis]